MQTALAPYRQDDFAEAIRLCREIAQDSANPAVAREAEALATLALLQSSDRGERLDARARLGLIIAAQPDIQDRAEYLLAQGRASRALDETAMAIEYLQAAASAFDAQQNPRALLAIAELADVWPVHGEWNVPVTGIDVAPRTPEANVALKISKLDELERRIEGRAGAAAVRARIELRRAELRAGGAPTAAIAELSRLAAIDPIDATVASAGLKLAELFESQSRWSDALRAYRRVAGASVAGMSERAARAAEAIEQPRVAAEMPAQATPDRPLDAKVRVRNISRLSVEVRRLELSSWIEKRRGRALETTLPEEGAVVLNEQRAAPPAIEHGWWDAQLSLNVPAGAYVVVMRDADTSASTFSQKRLLIVSDLEATVFTGTRHAIVCTNRPDARSQFWMEHSFAPLERKTEDGVIAFPLPPEARLRGERRWTCLVMSGDDAVLCEGRLTDEATDPDRVRDAIVSIAPREPRIGETITIAGLVQRSEAPPRAEADQLEIRLVDTLDRPLATLRTNVDAAGFFFVRTPATVEMAGKSLRAQLRQRDLLIETVYRRPLAQVAPRDAARLEASVILPQSFAAEAPILTGELDAQLPWRTPLGPLPIQYRVDGAALPTNRPLRDLLPALPQPNRTKLPESGRTAFAVSPKSFDVPPGPLAVGIGLTVTGPDARRAERFHQAIVNAQPVHLWVTPLPVEAQVGQPIRARVGWFDPESRAIAAWPSLAVYRAGTLIEQLPLFPGGGELQSALWIPAQPGEYEFRAALGDAAATLATVSEVVKVEAPGAKPQSAAIRAIERIDSGDKTRLRVQIHGKRTEPTLLLARDGDPRSATWIAPGADDLEREIELAGRVSANCRLIWLALTPGGVRVLDDRTVPVDVARRGAIELREAAGQNVRAGSRRVEIRSVKGESLAGAIVYARLVRGENSGTVVWRGRPTDQISRSETTLRFATSHDLRGDAALPEGRIGAPEPFAAEIAEVVLAGESLWAEMAPVGAETATIDVPLPEEPGRHRLHVYLRHPAGWSATGQIVLSDDRAVWLQAEVPEQLTRGDRTFLSVSLQNRTQQPISGTFSSSLGRGLTATSILIRDDRGRTIETPAGNPGDAAITISPQATIIAIVRIEATAEGRSAADVEFRSGERKFKASVPYRVFASAAGDSATAATTAAGDSDAAITLKRSVFWVDDVAAREAAAALTANPVPGQLPPRRADAPRVSIGDGESIPAGRLVVVQDEFTLGTAADRVAWTQRVPAHSVTHGGDIEGWKTVGPISDRTLTSVTYSSARVSAGVFTHETLLVPMRGGSCELPIPEIRIDGKLVRVRSEAAGFRVVVAE